LKTEKVRALKQSPVFATLDEPELAELSRLAFERRLVADEAVFWEGDDSGCFYIVAEGQVKVTKLTSTGKEVILAFFGTGEMFGEVAVLENEPYPASARAVTDAHLIGLRKKDFLAFLIRYPEVALKVISLLSGRLREAQSRLRDLAGERVEQRLARLLVRLSARLGPTLPFTRQELSDMAGTTTETTIRVFSQWKNRGILRSVRGRTTIADEVKLSLIAEGPPRV
jgi:CRP/FNR family transcriptional regulator, nitrogen oxide reductase regulator